MRALAVLAALSIASPAFAGTAVSLKSEIADGDGRVTLGELFDGAGAASDVQVARRTGPSVVLDAGAVQSAARRAGLDWDNAQGIRRIIVRQGAEGPAARVAPPGNVEVLTYARSLSAGEVVQPQDLVWSKAAAAPGDAPRDAELVIGQAAKRPLRAGSAVSMRDVAAPQVIASGELVQVSWSDGLITLTLQAKAMSNAGLGETLALQNTASKKTIEAVATGPGMAVAGPEAQRLKAARSSQYALR